eukprot:gene9842-11656_t
MDEDGKIIHPVLNRDESPQFVDFNTLRGNNIRRLVASSGESAVLPKQENRECVSIDVTMSLDGFMFGPHIIIARECLTESCAPDEVAVFDDCINEKLKYSTHSLISNNQCGVQTGPTLLQRSHLLDRELAARGTVRPVVEMTDNHDSRYDDDMMQFCEEKQIIKWSEKANTSGIFQALDQVNHQLHSEYNKGVREFKKLRKTQLAMRYHRKVDESEVKVNATDFLRIFCDIWFTWSTVMDRKIAWRRVGIMQECIAPDEINREHFVVHAGPEVKDSVPLSFADFSGSPEGVRKGTPEYFKRKLAAIRALGQEWETFETTPMLRGILEVRSVPPLPPKPSKGRLSDNNGSFSFNEVRKKKAAKKQAEQDARQETEFRALQQDLAKKQRDAEITATAAAKQQKLEALKHAWERCTPVCSCRPRIFVGGIPTYFRPCEIAGLKQCPVCKDIKKSKCAKAACKVTLAAVS